MFIRLCHVVRVKTTYICEGGSKFIAVCSNQILIINFITCFIQDA